MDIPNVFNNNYAQGKNNYYHPLEPDHVVNF